MNKERILSQLLTIYCSDNPINLIDSENRTKTKAQSQSKKRTVLHTIQNW